eukprot:TRINITY_DN6777_c0_g1_i4.p1 TRINITY_DN6777_c0_g1~~TRINITY_DN6777_c0_g1_i4.p1  ORF type:complete len:1438 (-),score=282.09 TRINITY_DN6777_c0_g1_i4:261-3965(-)
MDVSNCSRVYGGETCQVTCTGIYIGSAIYSCNLPPNFEGEGPSCKKKTCTVASLPQQSAVDFGTCANKAIGEVCEPACKDGYKSEKGFYTCEANGIFDGYAPTCVEQTCASWSLPAGIAVNVSSCAGISVGHNCSATCDSGFQGEATTISCISRSGASEGIYVGDAPTCEPQTCKVPSTLADPKFVHFCEGVEFGSFCFAGCADGYAQANPGLTKLACMAGNLSGDLPSCLPTACISGLPAAPALNTSACNGKTTGESCKVSCHRGYAMTGNAEATCTSSGAFSPINVSCSSKPCGSLSKIPAWSGASLSSTGCDGLRFSEKCLVRCSDGYTGSPAFLACDAADETQGAQGFIEAKTKVLVTGISPPSCEGKACEPGVPRILGLTHDCNGKRTSETCTVEAMPGYSAVSTTLTCDSSGNFLGTLPEPTPATCPDLAPDALIASNCKGKVTGTTCYAFCKSGQFVFAEYRCELVNGLSVPELVLKSASLSCPSRRLEVDGRRLQGHCDGSVASSGLDAPEYSSSCMSAASGEFCIVTCADGYTGVPERYVCEASGQLVGSLPACSPTPCTYNLPTGVGVVHDCDGVGTDSKCSASCGEGYEANASEFTCHSSGNFKGTVPTCSPKDCKPLAVGTTNGVENNCAGIKTGGLCFASCQPGFTSDGPAFTEQICELNGSFSGLLPNCIPNLCNNDSLPSDAQLSISDTCKGLRTNDSCTVTCANGYAGLSSTFRCDASGFLEGTKPACIPKTCAALTSDTKINHNCEGKVFGETCLVGCASGYQLAESSRMQIWTCALDDSGGVSLQGSEPACEPISCIYGLPTSNSISNDCDAVAFQQSCTVGCGSGYEGEASIFTCGSGKLFSGSPPVCAAQRCPQRAEPYTVDTCNATAYGSSCFATCMEGYSSTEDSKTQWTCTLATGAGLALVGARPSCQAKACIFGQPPSDLYQHNCSTATSGQSCMASCPVGYEGAATRLYCDALQTLQGSLPTCVLMTTTTSTSTRNAIIQNVTLDGDYFEVVTDKVLFLQECSVTLAPTVCIDVNPGSIILTLEAASQSHLDVAIPIIATQGLVLPSFGTIQQVPTSTQEPRASGSTTAAASSSSESPEQLLAADASDAPDILPAVIGLALGGTILALGVLGCFICWWTRAKQHNVRYLTGNSVEEAQLHLSGNSVEDAQPQRRKPADWDVAEIPTGAGEPPGGPAYLPQQQPDPVETEVVHFTKEEEEHESGLVAEFV